MLNSFRLFRRFVCLFMSVVMFYIAFRVCVSWTSISTIGGRMSSSRNSLPVCSIYDVYKKGLFSVTQCKSRLNLALVYIGSNREIFHKLKNTIKTILWKAGDDDLCFHIVTEPKLVEGVKVYINSLCNASDLKESNVNFYFHDIKDITIYLKEVLPAMRSHFGRSLHPLYFISTVIHCYFTPLDRLIMLDVDINIVGQLSELFHMFSKFTEDAIIGIANEQQPVYSHILSTYRAQTNHSEIGAPPPTGFPGLNSGVLLLDLSKMRVSSKYKRALNSTYIEALAKKYYFQGHLGDQDFYSLLSFEDPSLFYLLNCGWNRQLCQWWRYHGYAQIFDLYFKCDHRVNIYHGNCKSAL